MKEKHPALEIDGMMNAFVQYNRDQSKLEKSLSTTVAGIANISG